MTGSPLSEGGLLGLKAWGVCIAHYSKEGLTAGVVLIWGHLSGSGRRAAIRAQLAFSFLHPQFRCTFVHMCVHSHTCVPAPGAGKGDGEVTEPQSRYWFRNLLCSVLSA